ncbi:TetR/AcrR family transcriptional regulator [Deinococcus oregonensis]|uniref:TetR/AcrR family transcriptional regulator n=1 Tax=Deinococcus oregonensis TaxID=1805970 RepID=A0ABV6B006_9DEIO
MKISDSMPEERSKRTRARSPQAKAAMRTRLLDATLASLHHAEGWSVNAAAREAGLSKGTVYLYFDNAAALYIALLKEVIENRDNTQEAALVLRHAHVLADASEDERLEAARLVQILESRLTGQPASDNGNWPACAALIGSTIFKESGLRELS